MISALNATVECENKYDKRPDVSNQSYSPLQTLCHDFKVWLKQLLGVGFNLARYAINLLQKYLITKLIDDNSKLSPIKKGKSFFITHLS